MRWLVLLVVLLVVGNVMAQAGGAFPRGGGCQRGRDCEARDLRARRVTVDAGVTFGDGTTQTTAGGSITYVWFDGGVPIQIDYVAPSVGAGGYVGNKLICNAPVTASGDLFGSQVISRITSGTAGGVYGLYAGANAGAGSSVNTMTALHAASYATGDSTTAVNMIRGVGSRAMVAGSARADAGAAFYADEPYTHVGSSPASWINDAYGLYIEPQAGTSISRGWGVYQKGSTTWNYLEGPTRLKGVTTGSFGACNSGVEGTAQWDTTLHALMTCDATAWRETPRMVSSSITSDMAEVLAGACNYLVWAGSGIADGDPCVLGFSDLNNQTLIWSCQVANTNQWTVSACNPTGSPIDPPSRTYKVKALK